MESKKDAVATSLLKFVCKEHEIAETVIALLNLQLEFHQKCAERIKEVLPELKV